MTRDELLALRKTCPACCGSGWPNEWCHTCAGTGYVLPATDEVLGSAEPVTIRIAAPVSINIKTLDPPNPPQIRGVNDGDVVELHFRKPQWIHGYVQHITIDRNGEVVESVDEANAADFWREVALKAAEATDYDYPMNWDAERRLAEIADEVRAARGSRWSR